MKKIMLLMPALMLENNRKANMDAMKYALENYAVDEFVVYDQEFQESDYIEGFTYIGHQKERQGFVKPRNELLKYFYNSDADYALWLDANEKVSQTSLNDLATIIANLKEEKISSNVILSTLGIMISQERIFAKKRKDYFDNVYLIRCKKGYEWFHGMFMKNFKKYFNHEVYVDDRCDVWKGTNEDVYFIRLLHRLFECQLCPTIIMTKPSNKTSTWMQNEDNYNYPVADLPVIDAYIKENVEKYYSDIIGDKINNVEKLDRIKDENLQYLKKYKPRKK